MTCLKLLLWSNWQGGDSYQLCGPGTHMWGHTSTPPTSALLWGSICGYTL